MACGCIGKINESLAPHNTVLVTTMFLDPMVVVVATERIRQLRDGKKAATMLATFCPFCGIRYEDKPNG